MAATLISAPIPAPGFDADNWREREKAYIEDLSARATAQRSKPHNQASNDSDLVGKIVRWQRADGYASYMVWDVEPLRLVHLDLGDGYTVESALLRGLTLAEVRRMVEWEDSWKRASTEPNDVFYGSLVPGQIVHYHNSFGQFVRCEVVAADRIDSVRGNEPTLHGVALKPIALVGHVKRGKESPWKNEVGGTDGWFEHDLYSRDAGGEVHFGYHARQVFEGKLMQPHASNMYEYADFHDRLGIDPTKMPPIDLTPPPMTAEQEEIAPLARAASEIHHMTEGASLLDADGLRDLLEKVSDTSRAARWRTSPPRKED